MMKTVIDSATVVALAFADGGYVDPASVPETTIAVAEERWLIPVIGGEMHAALLEGSHADFREEYVAPVVALYTRLLMMPDLGVQTGQCGLTVPSSSTFEAASVERTRIAARSLRHRARTLLHRMSRHLDEHAAEFPEYDPEKNILKRCSTDGNIVQIR